MKVIVGFLIALVAIGQPTQALLGAKLALLSALTGGGGRSGGGYGSGGYGSGGYGSGGYGSGGYGSGGYGSGGYGSGGYGSGGYGSGGYGSGGYNGGYNQGYYSGGGGSYGGGYGSGEGYSYNRPSYSGGYGSSYQYGNGYSSGGEQVVRVIKVIVPQQQQYSSGGSVGYSSGWAPISAPAPAPVATSYIQPSASYVTTQAQSVAAPPPVVQVVSAPASQPGPVQVQVPQEPVQVSRPPQPVQVPVSGPQLLPPNIQSSVKTVRVIVDEPSWSSGGYSHVPSQTYGPPSSSSVPVGWGQNGPEWGSSGWSSSGSGNWNNNGLKSGGIWEKLGC